MDNLKNISEFGGGTLWVIGDGFFSPHYELTDNAHSYARMTSDGILSSDHIVTTADSNFTIAGMLWHTVDIRDAAGQLIGATSTEFFKTRTELWLEDGFKASYIKPSLWSDEYVWQNQGTEEELMRITFNYSLSLTAVVNFQRAAVTISHFLLLVFLAVKLRVITQTDS